MYEDGGAVWLVDDRWGMVEVNLLKSQWCAWLLPEPSAYPDNSVESVFRHEVAHLALAARAGGAPLPRWFHEGVAMSIDRGWDTSGRLRLLLEMIRGPRTEQLGQLFASNTQPESALAYGLSAALVADLQQRHDPSRGRRARGAGGGGRPFARGFEIETGETPDSAASRAWAAYRRWTNWSGVDERHRHLGAHPRHRRRGLCHGTPQAYQAAPGVGRRGERSAVGTLNCAT